MPLVGRLKHRAAGLEAARTIQRRMKARMRYRRIRDRGLADLLGKEFDYQLRDEITGNVQPQRLRLTGYDPGNGTVHAVVHLRPVDRLVGTVTWDSDTFWSMLRHGVLVPC